MPTDAHARIAGLARLAAFGYQHLRFNHYYSSRLIKASAQPKRALSRGARSFVSLFCDTRLPHAFGKSAEVQFPAAAELLFGEMHFCDRYMLFLKRCKA